MPNPTPDREPVDLATLRRVGSDLTDRAADEIERLEVQGRRFYASDGSYELLPSHEDVAIRQQGLRLKIKRLAKERDIAALNGNAYFCTAMERWLEVGRLRSRVGLMAIEIILLNCALGTSFRNLRSISWVFWLMCSACAAIRFLWLGFLRDDRSCGGGVMGRKEDRS